MNCFVLKSYENKIFFFRVMLPGLVAYDSSDDSDSSYTIHWWSSLMLNFYSRQSSLESSSEHSSIQEKKYALYAKWTI